MAKKKAKKAKKTVKAKKPKKTFGLEWLFENIEEHETFAKKRMFGGLAAYLHDRMVMLLAEDPDNCEYRGKTYGFEIWNGVLLPVSREDHVSLQSDFPTLVSHPVLGKWLYLPMSDPDFEAIATELANAILRNDMRFGIYPKLKKKKV